jgi:hypothetical protein
MLREFGFTRAVEVVAPIQIDGDKADTASQ